ncbi:hypothetical protein JAO76_15350 [Pontibacter sp. BT310]|uniref:Uncharacterized protein n=1 Tax=Pontibacter populi TaxID=890055 RepID=A0ABS6XFZ4_9BACT|nr:MULTISPECIES: hypothetical protein [Pontibacter]MBJ6119585.1 hypothetical protein [Pontibacter sp. BT310]MBR0572012.1 hypothetical protein [Microvirga sp. STS03]MBW3366438.1 hypothetical protein [Pontibacter populi]
MKKIYTLLLLILGSYTMTLAQQQPASQFVKATTVEEYVRVSVRSFLVRKNYTAYLNYGDADKRNGHITDKPGEKREFFTPMGVLTYMAKEGWQFVAFIPDDDGKITDQAFLMKRELPVTN